MSRFDNIMDGLRSFNVIGGLTHPTMETIDSLGAGAPPSAGKRITPDNALSIPAFYAGVRLLAETVRIMPLEVFTPGPGGTLTPQPTSRMWNLLGEQANPEQSAPEVWELIVAWLNIRGNGFLFMERDSFGRVIALWPIAPQRVRVARRNGQKVYMVFREYVTERETPEFGTAEDIIHFKGFGTDGLVGLSPVHMHRETLSIASAEQEVQGRLLANNARPSGILTTDLELSPEAERRILARWKRSHQGLANTAKTAVLEGGLKWQQTSLSMADAQFLEQRKYSAVEIAQILRVPAGRIEAEVQRSKTYQNTAEEGLNFLTYSMLPQTSRIEEPLNICPSLQLAVGQKVKFNPDVLLRVQRNQRFVGHGQAIKDGWMSRNEIRHLENLPPGPPELDEFAKPGAAPAANPADNNQGDTDPNNAGDGTDNGN